MSKDLPAITGPQLIKLLEHDGWIIKRKAKHGKSLAKKIGDRTRVTIISTRKQSLPIGTLMDILSKDQTGLGKEGLLKLLKKK